MTSANKSQVRDTAVVDSSQKIESQDLKSYRQRADRLLGKLDELSRQKAALEQQLLELNDFLSISESVTEALEQLSHDIFQKQLSVIESTLTKALQEVLEQPIVFKATASFSHDMTKVDFSILRDGNAEDIMRGQGGSVANVVSVGLRLFAITTLDERRHRKFLVLDEQDCWLHPSLVPKLTKIVQEAGTALGFQVLMISHHDVSNFLRFADRIYRLSPDKGDGVKVELVEDERTVMERDEEE